MVRTKNTEVDFFVDPRPLTLAEQQQISDFIKQDKDCHKAKKGKKAQEATL